MSDQIILISNIDPEKLGYTGLTVLETLAYLLTLSGCDDGQSLLNNIPTKDILNQVFAKQKHLSSNLILGHRLVKAGIILPQQLLDAITYHLNTGAPLELALISLRMCTPEQIERVLLNDGKTG